MKQKEAPGRQRPRPWWFGLTAIVALLSAGFPEAFEIIRNEPFSTPRLIWAFPSGLVQYTGILMEPEMPALATIVTVLILGCYVALAVVGIRTARPVWFSLFLAVALVNVVGCQAMRRGRVLEHVWADHGKLRVFGRQTNDQIRQSILTMTPPGTSSADVLNCLSNRLYVCRVASLDPAATGPHRGSRVFAILDAYTDSLWPMLLTAEWRFDADGRMTELKIARAEGSL